MSRRIFVVLAAMAFAAAPLVEAADASYDNICMQESLPTAMAPRPDLSALFAHAAAEESIETEQGVAATMGPLELIVARIGTDGKPVMACVDNEESARRFLDKPAEKIQQKKAQEH